MADRKLYDAGWDDGIDYNRDVRNLEQHKVGSGMLLMLTGAIIVALTGGIMVAMWLAEQTIYNWPLLICMWAFSSVLVISGYFLDNKDRVRYKEREAAHYKKWSDRWIELGLNGDD